MSSLLQTARRALAKTTNTSRGTPLEAVPVVNEEPGPASAPPASLLQRAAFEPSSNSPCVRAKTRQTPRGRSAKNPVADGGPLTGRTTPAVCGWCGGVLAPYLLPLAGRGPALLCPTCKRWTVIGGTA